MLDNVLPYIRERWNAAPPQIALLGTSMGGQGEIADRFQAPKQISGDRGNFAYHRLSTSLENKEGDEILPLMYADQESARQDTATLHVHPLNWPLRHISGSAAIRPIIRRHEKHERLRSKLVALGIPHEYDLETSGGGHGFSYYNRMAPTAMKFITEELEHERLRRVIHRR